ncbi:MAG: hypothetical protein IPH21_02380 [Flavobacteriales bacterium]|nr:hypothetical protein [Flavobacteriales bacterium]
MRHFLLSLTFLFSFQGFAQLNNWDPSWYPTDSALVFHDDLDFYLNAYTKKEIKQMRKQVNMWRMNFDKMMLNTIREVRSYSEGGGMVPKTHDMDLPVVITGGNYSLSGHSGRIRAFMFGSITSPPARVQMERWTALAKKYAKEDVDIFVVYGKEMHPADKGNFKKYPIPTTIEQKTQYAAQFSQWESYPCLWMAWTMQHSTITVVHRTALIWWIRMAISCSAVRGPMLGRWST